MIIVKTKTGDAFINDKETLEFTFDREKSEVHIYRESNYLPHSKIENVESVAYTNDANPTFYSCDGSLVKQLNKRIDRQILETQELYKRVEFYEDKLEKIKDVVTLRFDDKTIGPHAVQQANKIKEFIEGVQEEAKKLVNRSAL